MYVSFTLDRTIGGVCIIASEKGGVNIEEVHPSKIRAFMVPLKPEIDEKVVEEVA